METNERDFHGLAEGEKAIEQLGTVHREREKTKRLLIGSAVLLFIVASIVIIFAPAGKEKLSLVLGVTLIIFALGAIGVVSFKIKVPGISVVTSPENKNTIDQKADKNNKENK